MPLETSAEQPIPVRTVARLIGDWIARLGRVWVEGQVAQLNRRPGATTVFVTLRDPVANVSMTVTCPAAVLDAVVPPVVDGSRVVVHGRPDFYLNRGTLSLVAIEIRSVGLGALLARIEALRVTLAAEGLFADDRKKPLPFLPQCIGLICGRGSAAEHDVLENARARWPAAAFRIENVAVQGVHAVPEITDALHRLDRDAAVDVIVVTRGGGSVEDLLAFSEESLLRVVSTCRTPVVSAIGHEQDSPLLDLVADVRASTPTDAARRVVPHMAEEVQRIQQSRSRARAAVAALLQREQRALDAVRGRPVLATPTTLLAGRADAIIDLQRRTANSLSHALDRSTDTIAHLRAQVIALSPAATLERGYAVVQDGAGAVVRDPDQVSIGSTLRVRVAAGELQATRTD